MQQSRLGSPASRCHPAGKRGRAPRGLPEQPGAGLAGLRVLRGLGWLAALPLAAAAAAAAADAAGECGPSEVALADAEPAALTRAGAALQADAAAAAAEARPWLAVCIAVHGGVCVSAHSRPRLATAALEEAEVLAGGCALIKGVPARTLACRMAPEAVADLSAAVCAHPRVPHAVVETVPVDAPGARGARSAGRRGSGAGGAAQGYEDPGRAPDRRAPRAGLGGAAAAARQADCAHGRHARTARPSPDPSLFRHEVLQTAWSAQAQSSPEQDVRAVFASDAVGPPLVTLWVRERCY